MVIEEWLTRSIETAAEDDEVVTFPNLVFDILPTSLKETCDFLNMAENEIMF